MEYIRFKNKFYPSPSKFFKIECTSFGVIILKDVPAPSLQNDAFDLQTGWSGPPVLVSEKQSMTDDRSDDNRS